MSALHPFKPGIAALMAGVVLVPALACAQPAAFLTPDSSTYPFEDWSRGDEKSIFAYYDFFSDSSQGGTNPPNSSFGPDLPPVNVSEMTGGAIPTSGGNIYSFSTATDFDVTIPFYGYGTGNDTRVVVQIGTIGSHHDPSSVKLTYLESEEPQALPPDYSEELFLAANPDQGGDYHEVMYVWDVAGANPDEFLLEFNAEASSMSLDLLAIDLFIQGSATPVPGDYDSSGAVDSGDFDLWLSLFGSDDPRADGNADGVVDSVDYAVWRTAMAAAPAAQAAATAPEPGAAMLAALFGFAILFSWGSHRAIASHDAGKEPQV